jgi:retron-type reverse transcriptase
VETYRTVFCHISSYGNLYNAFQKAQKGKRQKDYVIEFESNLDNNLRQLKYELEDFTYHPSPLKEFIVRDPKTRKIGASNFRDRVVYHAICNIIAPIFEKRFIHDSFANQVNKGTHKAVKRAEKFIQKFIVQHAVGGVGVTLRKFRSKCIGYAFKADIRHYFDTVDHEILLEILKEKIKDPDAIWLVKLILSNHKTEIKGKGMPLGNLTSQFFANVYLDKLDQYIKHELKIKYYIRYVDDFVIFHKDKAIIEAWKKQIG